ncbi:MAG: IclR family transcriptional regulator [Proteobacteria bacterium]|nr:IclR family transcriptional regulator [Pseudomonadota bacterium]
MSKSVVKAFMLLELLSTSDHSLGVTALSQMSDLGKSNVHRLLQTLIQLGYVKKADDNTYEATLRMWEVGSHVIARLTVRDVARPYMNLLSKMTRETVHLSELDGLDVLYIEKIDSEEPVKTYTQLGGRGPAYSTATGKAMLAYADPARIAECLSTAQQFTAKTITHLGRFEAEAAKIRQQRYAINRGEWRSDVIGLAAPIAGSSGSVSCAIGLSAPASRLELTELDTLAPRLVEYAEKISRSLGCSARKWALLGKELTP